MGAILVVDDEVDVAKGWARALRIAKHDVSYAQDSKTALQLSHENPFDLVILDYMMPGMTGIELLNEIRKDHPFIRSIIISGKIDKSISETSVLSEIGTSIEADLYLHKPVENTRLKEAVESLLEKTSQDDWQSMARSKLESVATKKKVRAAEKALHRNRAKKK